MSAARRGGIPGQTSSGGQCPLQTVWGKGRCLQYTWTRVLWVGLPAVGAVYALLFLNEQRLAARIHLHYNSEPDWLPESDFQYQQWPWPGTQRQ